MYLDLAELDQVFARRWLWSTRGPAPAWFRRQDHLGDPAQPLDQAVRGMIEQRLGRRPEGPIRLLTQLRYLGYVMNPVSFYYCYDRDDQRVETVVAEVHNTPWGEEHCYVLDFRESTAGDPLAIRHRKAFHVSPFMGMDMDYAWRLTAPASSLSVDIQNRRDDGLLFDASLRLERREITGWRLAWVLARYPWITVRVILAIYWQALWLWIKRVPYVPHPGGKQEQELTA